MKTPFIEGDSLFYHTFRHAMIGMALLDLDGTYLNVNPSFSRIVGYDEETLQSMNVWTLLHPDDAATAREAGNRLIQGEMVCHRGEKRFIRRDGRHVWVYNSVSIVRDREGAPLFFVVQSQNISERKRIEHRFLEQEERYRSLFDQNPDIVYSLTLDGEIVSVNDSWSRLTGYEREDFIEKMPLCFEEELQFVTKQSYLTSEPFGKESEVSLLHKNGGLLVLSVTHMPIMVDGEIEGMYGVAKDVTKRDELVRELRERERKYRLLADYSMDMIASCNPFGSFTYVSPASLRLFGYAPEELIGRSGEALFGSEGLEKPSSELWREGQSSVARCRRKDGSFLWVETTHRSIRSPESGKVLDHVIVVRDVSRRMEREHALQRSEESLSIAQQIARLGSWDWDIVNDRLTCSDELHHLLGAELGQLETLGAFLECVVPEDRPRIETALAEAYQGKPYDIEMRAARPNGDIRYLHCMAKLFFDESGKPIRMIGTDQDITERKVEQQRLREAQLVHQMISECSQDIVAITSPLGIVEYVSSAVTSLGYTAEEWVGRRATDFFEAEDYHKFQQKEYEDNDVFVFRLLHKDGSSLWYETKFKILRDELGEVARVISVGRDISDRIRAEEAIRSREESYRVLVEHSPDAILVGIGERFFFVNDTAVALFGARSKEELLRCEPLSLVHPDSKLEFYHRWLTVGQGEVAEVTEQKYVRLNGQTIDVEAKAIPIQYQGQSAVHLIVRDISTRKRTEQLLQQSDKWRVAGELAAGIAHEIRNPLTSIKGFLKLMRQQPSTNRSYIDIMQSEMSRMETIVGELLQLTRPKATNFRMHDLVHIVGFAIALLESQANYAGIGLVPRFHVDELPAHCDENQLKQVLINVLKNAIEAMPQGGDIVVELDRVDGYASIRVVDHGTGIPEEVLAKLGQPFLTTKETGTGLGLSICYNMIEAHKGSMTVESRLGEGTIVTVFLPLQ
ncbi:PAS domain S-box protein [Paenibacillus sp. TRM 82003]|nr:PAS domain S-box protein [Paenibacillus sp. TRM 82003]